ncbi:hypothetical protein LHFGNBLO_000042 [Mesorhizobium sp. AR10]|uniref:hypothetical protein n=1 Tax=Mesorhizobium sp. AR10 TaxID=2865839 RepID=UPI0021601B9B|nr:hypothetical protein [Mesorhizobium sp. AR10]UVK38761.1 hypothetical protein LHFGNBLO_000042 [Mesorhizobium sp. AR10]
MSRPLLSILISSVCLSAATVMAAGQGARLSAAEIDNPVSSAALVDNKSFLAPPDAAKAHETFEGTLKVSEAPMLTEPAKFKKDNVLGKNPQIFPAVSLSFVADGDDLIPSTQDVIRNGTLPGGHSFWDIIVQPGKIWSEPSDDGWSRASFPFSLVNSIEGETHNGVATFVYKAGKLSHIRYQILQQTSPFYIEDYFTAAGSLTAEYAPAKIPNAQAVIDTFKAAQADEETIASWSDLEAKVGKDKLEGFDSAIRPNEIVLDGLMIDDRFYLKSCPTPAGELPYCEHQRFGVWSVTKSAATAVAMLSIAQKYGPDIFTTKIADYVDEAKGVAGWQDVTFGDALNMATGMGYGTDKAEPINMFDPYADDYYGWYEAPTAKQKVGNLIKSAKPYSWGPEKVARYRDEDFFLLGVGLTNYLKKKEGPDANVWTYIVREVYGPIGIHYAPTNKTIEPNPKGDQPLMAYGYYPTISDLIKIARLYQNGGKFGDKQLLNAEMLADINPATDPVGLPTGVDQKPFYRKAFWRAHYKSSDCSFYYPIMDGWGENYVLLLPKGVTAFRLAKNWDGDAGAGNLDNMAAVGGRLKPFCQ